MGAGKAGLSMSKTWTIVDDRRPDDDVADTDLRTQIRTRINAAIVRMGNAQFGSGTP